MRRRLTVLFGMSVAVLSTAAYATDTFNAITFVHTKAEGINLTVQTDSNGQTCGFVTNGKAQGMACWSGASQAPSSSAWSDSTKTYLQLTPRVGMGWGCVIAYTKYIDMVDKVCTDGCADCGCMICLNSDTTSSQSQSFGPGPF